MAPETRLPPTAYDLVTNDRGYRGLRDHAKAAIAGGYSAIVDAAFLREVERDEIRAVASAARVPFLGLWLEAGGDILARRIAGRGKDASNADLSVLRSQRAMDLGAIDWHRIDAERDAAAIAAAASALLDRT